MKKLNIFGMILGVFTVSQQTLAKLVTETNTKSENFENKNTNNKFINICQKFNFYENKITLTEEEYVKGKLLHDILMQVSTNPLQYCNNLAMSELKETEPN